MTKATGRPRGPAPIDLTGRRFGRLTPIKRFKTKYKVAVWECLCDCGNTTFARTDNLIRGIHESCGCTWGEAHITHGATVDKTTPTYNSWASMIQRCAERNTDVTKNYGDRGIIVCERWRQFKNFLADMGERPSGKTLDRYPDVNGNYEPGNCRWATHAEQCRNKRCNRWFTYCGRTFCVADWERVLYLPKATISKNLHRGKTFPEAIVQVMKTFHGGRAADEFLETLCPSE